MLQTKKISDDNVLVLFEPSEIMIRKSGKIHYGTERSLITFKDNKMVIHTDTAKEYGITIETK